MIEKQSLAYETHENLSVYLSFIKSQTLFYFAAKKCFYAGERHVRIILNLSLHSSVGYLWNHMIIFKHSTCITLYLNMLKYFHIHK
jgi:hypothetical protein